MESPINKDTLVLGRLESGVYLGAVEATINGASCILGVRLAALTKGRGWHGHLLAADGTQVAYEEGESRKEVQNRLTVKSLAGYSANLPATSEIDAEANEPTVCVHTIWGEDRNAYITRSASGWGVYTGGGWRGYVWQGGRRSLAEATRLAKSLPGGSDGPPPGPPPQFDSEEPDSNTDSESEPTSAEGSSTHLDTLEQQFGALGQTIAGAIRSHSGSADSQDVAAIAREAAQEAVKGSARTIHVEGTAPTPQEVDGPVPDCLDWVLKLAASRIPILLKGPTGCGKTHLGKQVAEGLGLGFRSISCTEGMSEAKLTGYLVPGESGRFEYRETDFVRCYRDGGVFLFDEMDAADPNVLMVINQALANGWLPIPEHPDGGVKRHADFVPMAAANTWGHGPDARYVGRAQIDEATLDRFRMGMVDLDYSETVEEAIVDPDILSWGRSMRKAIATAGLRRTVSTRALADMTKLKAQHDLSLIDLASAFMADWTKEERDKVA